MEFGAAEAHVFIFVTLSWRWLFLAGTHVFDL